MALRTRRWRNELRLHRRLLVIRWPHSELERSVSPVFYSWISKDPLRGWSANRPVQMCPLTHCLVTMSPQDDVGGTWLEYTAAGCSDFRVFSWATTCLWLLGPQNLETGFLTPWGHRLPMATRASEFGNGVPNTMGAWGQGNNALNFSRGVLI